MTLETVLGTYASYYLSKIWKILNSKARLAPRSLGKRLWVCVVPRFPPAESGLREVVAAGIGLAGSCLSCSLSLTCLPQDSAYLCPASSPVPPLGSFSCLPQPKLTFPRWVPDHLWALAGRQENVAVSRLTRGSSCSGSSLDLATLQWCDLGQVT